MTWLPEKNFREVSKEKFFDVIGPGNNHPSMRDPLKTYWINQTDGVTVAGISIPGWRNPSAEKRYFLPM